MNEKQLCNYIERWYAARMDDWSTSYHGIHRSKHTGIYLLPHGEEMVNVLNNVYDNFEEHLSYQNLLPDYFSSPHQLLVFLKNYRTLCQEHLDWILTLPKSVLEHFEVADIANMLYDVVEMATYCIDTYEVSMADDSYDRPYIRMRESLLHEDIASFISEINIILNEIPFSIYKNKDSEGRYHSIIHAILFQLGFRVVSEKASNLGRLDLLLELEKYVYVFEFKYSKNGDKFADFAIQQIKDKKYALSYINSSKKVYAVGVTVGGKEKDAYDWKVEKLN